MSRSTALGGDALDALFSHDPKQTDADEKSAKQAAKAAEPEVEPAPTPKVGKRKVGRPRGPNYGVKKTTRWKRSDGAEMRARSVHIPVDVDKRLRRLAADEDKPVGQVIVEMLDQHLPPGPG